VKLRDADARNLALQKTLDRTNEELRFFRLSDSSKAGQLKDELFQTQQKAKDRETELTLELDKATKKLAKTQDQLDQFVLSLHQEQQNTAAAIEELTEVSDELRALKASNAKMLEESEERDSENAELAEAQGAEKSKELAVARSRAQEELMVKMYKMKNEHEEHTRKMLDEHAATIHRMEAQVFIYFLLFFIIFFIIFYYFLLFFIIFYYFLLLLFFLFIFLLFIFYCLFFIIGFLFLFLLFFFIVTLFVLLIS
jgi:Flp pilus assembly protein TadB